MLTGFDILARLFVCEQLLALWDPKFLKLIDLRETVCEVCGPKTNYMWTNGSFLYLVSFAFLQFVALELLMV